MIKILHVDDEENCLELTREIMVSYDKDIKIMSMTSPNKVLEKVLENEPDLVLSDYSMPEMNGIELTRLLKKYTNVPVIIYTGSDEETVAQEAFDAGVEDYITKACDAIHFIVLLKRIKNAVDSYRIRKNSIRDLD